MRFFVRVAAVVMATAFVATLVGCTPDEGPLGATVANTPSPSSTAIFASDNDAKVAAEAAYQGYTEASDAIAQDGGTKPDRVAPWVTARWLQVELADSAAWRRAGEKVSGSTRYFRFEIQRVAATPEGAAVGAYVCVDVSRTKLLNRSGKDITPSDRADVYALELEFVSGSPPNRLVLGRSAPWSNPARCA